MKRSTLLVLAAPRGRRMHPGPAACHFDGGRMAPATLPQARRHISRTGGRQGGATGMVQDQWSFYGTVAPAALQRQRRERRGARVRLRAQSLRHFPEHRPWPGLGNQHDGQHVPHLRWPQRLAQGPQEGPGRLERCCAAWATSSRAQVGVRAFGAVPRHFPEHRPWPLGSTRWAARSIIRQAPASRKDHKKGLETARRMGDIKSARRLVSTRRPTSAR